MTRRRVVRSAVFIAAVALLASTTGALPAGAREGTAQDVPGMRWLADIWCGTDGVCLGVGFTPQDVGAVVVLRAAGPSGPVRPVPGTSNLWQIACAPGGSCVAVGDGGGRGVVVEVSPDGTPGPVHTVPGATELLDVACPTATTCVATGVLSTPTSTFPYLERTPLFVVINNGQPGPVQGFPRRTGNAVGIACPSTTTCLVAVAGTGFVVLTNANGTWSSTLHTVSSAPGAGYPGEEISCASSTCYATAVGFISNGSGYAGVPAMMAVSPAGTAGPVQILSYESGTADDISCNYGRTCTVVGQSNATAQGLVIDVSRGSSVATTWANSNFFTGVSCIAAGTCGIVGNSPTGGVFGWHGRVPA